MKATLHDPAFGHLAWDEDAESYRGSVEFRPGSAADFTLIVHNAEEVRPREFAAFLAASRTHYQQLRQDDARFRRRAAGVVEKAILKKGASLPDAGSVSDHLRVHTIEMDNAGITVLYYDTAGLVPNKRAAVAFDMTGEIHLAQLVR
jgi:hypothetical protein